MSALPPRTDVGRHIQVSIWLSVYEYTPQDHGHGHTGHTPKGVCDPCDHVTLRRLTVTRGHNVTPCVPCDLCVRRGYQAARIRHSACNPSCGVTKRSKACRAICESGHRTRNGGRCSSVEQARRR
jgi:hypothetical protein